MAKIKVKHPVTGKINWVEESALTPEDGAPMTPASPPASSAPAPAAAARKSKDILFDDDEIESL